MNRQQMTEISRREMAHIPDWPYHQRVLRMHYFNNRMHSLGRKSGDYPDDPLEILRRSMRDARASEHVKPDQKFDYDKSFFEEESRKRKER